MKVGNERSVPPQCAERGDLRNECLCDMGMQDGASWQPQHRHSNPGYQRNVGDVATRIPLHCEVSLNLAAREELRSDVAGEHAHPMLFGEPFSQMLGHNFNAAQMGRIVRRELSYLPWACDGHDARPWKAIAIFCDDSLTPTSNAPGSGTSKVSVKTLGMPATTLTLC